MPYLYKLAGGCIVSRNIRVFGLGESNMENILHDMMEKSANPTIAPYARIPLTTRDIISQSAFQKTF